MESAENRQIKKINRQMVVCATGSWDESNEHHLQRHGRDS